MKLNPGERKRALMVAIGGRIFPDIQALQAIRPHLIIIMTTKEGCLGESSLRLIAQALSQEPDILPTLSVSSDDPDAIRDACVAACQPYSQDEWDWAFSIGSCPKLMAIILYDVAREMQIPCLHMDSAHNKVISLVKDIGFTGPEFFHMNIRRYMQIYNRSPKDFTEEELRHRSIVEQERWGKIARTVALSPDNKEFISLMNAKKASDLVDLPPSLLKSSLLESLQHHRAIRIYKDGISYRMAFTNSDFAKLLGTGEWLEVYVWHEAKRAGFADDCQWGYEIHSTAKNELDLALTFHAQLMIVECKARKKPFDTTYLAEINSKAAMLGGPYTTCGFVTYASKDASNYANFSEQAKLRKIFVVTAEELPDVGSILKQEAETPTYPRM